jgi:hypothetical protein
MRNLVVAALLAASAVPVGAQSVQFEAMRGAVPATGQWRYARTADGSEARFGTLFAIRCIAASRLVVLRRVDGAPPASLTIVTDMVTRAIPASGTLGASDPLLDAIAFSRGRFFVMGGSAAMLVLPALPEAARSIEDCRN